MLLRKAGNVIEPKKCYLLLNLETAMHKSSEVFIEDDIPFDDGYGDDNLAVYTGPVRVFSSLVALNDYLIGKDVDGEVKDISLIWSESSSIDYSDWKNIFNAKKDMILNGGY